MFALLDSYLGDMFSPDDAAIGSDWGFQENGSQSAFMDPLAASAVAPTAPITVHDLHFIQMVGTASHQTLLQSSNPHYSKLYQENMLLKVHVFNERSLNSRLQAKIQELEEKLERGITTVENHTQQAQILSGLLIPPPPAPLDRKDFPNVRFWSLKEWNDYRFTRQRNNETISKLSFITTRSGEPVESGYLEQMSVMARSLFNELHTRGLAPPTWKAKSKTVSDFFVNTIVLKFPELHWCEGASWKAEAFAVTRYPDCSRKFFNTGCSFQVVLGLIFFFSDDPDDEPTRKRRRTDKEKQSKKKLPPSPTRIEVANAPASEQ